MNEISNKWIGKNTIRPDGADKVTESRFTYHYNTCLAYHITLSHSFRTLPNIRCNSRTIRV